MFKEGWFQAGCTQAVKATTRSQVQKIKPLGSATCSVPLWLLLFSCQPSAAWPDLETTSWASACPTWMPWPQGQGQDRGWGLTVGCCNPWGQREPAWPCDNGRQLFIQWGSRAAAGKLAQVVGTAESIRRTSVALESLRQKNRPSRGGRRHRGIGKRLRRATVLGP